MTHSYTYEYWRTSSIPWRLATLLPVLCIAGAVMIALLYAPAISAKAVAVGAGLIALQATRDHYRAHGYRDVTLMVGALTAADTITPLADAVASPLGQAGLLLTLLVAPAVGYGLHRVWHPSIISEKVLRIGLPLVAVLPLLVLYLYVSVVVPRIQMVYLAGILALVLVSLGYWHAHMTVTAQSQRGATPRLPATRPVGRLPARTRRWNAHRDGG